MNARIAIAFALGLVTSVSGHAPPSMCVSFATEALEAGAEKMAYWDQLADDDVVKYDEPEDESGERLSAADMTDGGGDGRTVSFRVNVSGSLLRKFAEESNRESVNWQLFMQCVMAME